MTAALPGPTSHVYYSQRLRLHYVDWGNESAPPLLLVHGGRDHCRNWDWAAEELRHDYHVIAPDLRGHGDSQWSLAGTYGPTDFVYDIAQLVHQKELAPVAIISHSLGGHISLQYAGIYPEMVSHLVAIEGLGPPPSRQAERAAKPVHERLAEWMDHLRGLSGRTSRRYASIEDAFRRMQEENPHLTADQARHLTIHGADQNEDGTYSWKFDNYVRGWPPYGLAQEDIHLLWGRITCPTLLVRGTESWASDPTEDGRLAHFRNARARAVNVEGAGHWVHHDRLAEFMRLVREFLDPSD